jgi:hypothetical protein
MLILEQKRVLSPMNKDFLPPLIGSCPFALSPLIEFKEMMVVVPHNANIVDDFTVEYIKVKGARMRWRLCNWNN